MEQSPSWEANWFAASQEIPRISRNPKVHYRTHKRPLPVSILGQPNQVHIPTSHLLEIHPNIIHPSTPRTLQWALSLRFPHQDPIKPPLHFIQSKPCSSVVIATELRAGRSGIGSRWGREFPPVQTGPGAHPASCKIGTGSFPGVKCGRGVLLTTHLLLVPRSWKSIAIPLPTLWATPGL